MAPFCQNCGNRSDDCQCPRRSRSREELSKSDAKTSSIVEEAGGLETLLDKAAERNRHHVREENRKLLSEFLLKSEEKSKSTVEEMGKQLRQEMKSEIGKLRDEVATSSESRTKSNGDEEDQHIIVTGWITERDEKCVLNKINEFIDKNGWRAKVKEVWCDKDQTNFGKIEFHTAASTKRFLRGLAKATDMQIEDGKTMRFGRHRTIAQRADDKRLGLIKHLLAQFEDVELKDVKIKWTENIVRLKSEDVYKKAKDGERVYSGKAIDVKEQVEEKVRLWLEERGSEDLA